MRTSQKIRCLTLAMVIMAMFSIVASTIKAVVQKQIMLSTGASIYADNVKPNPTVSNRKSAETFIYDA